MTTPNLDPEPKPVKRPRTLIRASVVRHRLGGISGPSLWRLERQEPMLAAARCYVASHKCFDEEAFERFLDDFLARPHDVPVMRLREGSRARKAANPKPCGVPGCTSLAQKWSGRGRPPIYCSEHASKLRGWSTR
jgi:hypothetical protein